MIQINTAIHTGGGLIIKTGSVLDVTPHFLNTKKVYKKADEVNVFDKVIYSLSFDVKIYKSLTNYKSEVGSLLVNETIKEFNIGYTIQDVDIKSLTSIDGLLQLLVDHIENGDENYIGVGVGKCAIVYP